MGIWLALLGKAFISMHGRIRAVPEIILGGGKFFFWPLHPQDTHGVRTPWPTGQFCEPDPPPPGHVSALINPCPTVDQMRLEPQDKLTPPTPWTGLVREVPHPSDTSTKHPPPPQDKTVPVAHPPTCRIISGTALSGFHFVEPSGNGYCRKLIPVVKWRTVCRLPLVTCIVLCCRLQKQRSWSHWKLNSRNWKICLNL